MIKKFLMRCAVTVQSDYFVIFLGMVCWGFVLASLPLGEPMPIYAGY